MKRLEARRDGDYALSDTWQALQEDQPGTELPDDFPDKTALAAVGYVAGEDLTGADTNELVTYAGLSTRAADAVLAAHAAL